MRNFIIPFFFVACIACREESASPTAPINDDFDPTQATLLRSGMLMGVGHDVSGTASIYEQSGKKIVFLSPYMSQNGPDLKVYLSKDGDASEYINLGNLKSITGDQSYEVPGNPDASEYKFVIIWCQKFTVLFGVAETK